MSRRSSESGTGGGHMAASLTDLMTSLMVLFILLFVAALNNVGVKRRVTTTALLDSLQTRLADIGLDPSAIRKDEKDPFAIIVVMPDSLLFARGSSEVRLGGQQFLNTMIPTLSAILCAKNMASNIDNVVVEGHTDTTYFGIRGRAGTDQGPAFNLRLSQERSMEVVRTSLNTLGGSPERPCFRAMISASGRGQEERLQEYPGDDPRQRRVVFKIRVKADVAAGLADDVSNTSTRVQFQP